MPPRNALALNLYCGTVERMTIDDFTKELEEVGEFYKSEPCYDFDLYRVMFDPQRNAYRVGEDSGCSCPSPFEDFTSDADWGKPMSAGEVVAGIRKVSVEPSCLSGRQEVIDAVASHAKERGLW